MIPPTVSSTIRNHPGSGASLALFSSLCQTFADTILPVDPPVGTAIHLQTPKGRSLRCEAALPAHNTQGLVHTPLDDIGEMTATSPSSPVGQGTLRITPLVM